MIHWFETAVRVYLLHPLTGAGYQWWSGAGSDLGELTLCGLALTFLRRHNCHQRGCWRLGHLHPAHGWPACKQHYHDPPEHVKESP